MSTQKICPKCKEKGEMHFIDHNDWEENWVIDKEEWDYCTDCMEEIQVQNTAKQLWID